MTERLVNQHVVDELRAENDRLKRAILSYGKGEQFDWDILGRLDDLETELAAAKAREEKVRADVAALRGLLRCFHADKAPSFGDPNSVKAFKLVWEKLNKLETFKEVT